MKAIRLLLVSFFVLCVSTTNVVANSVTDQTYPRAQAEVFETFLAIAGSIVAGAGGGFDGKYMDQLISFHAYGDKFVEFNNGEVFNSAENEFNERMLFGVMVDRVKKFEPLPGTDLKIAVYYGNVANLTFTSNFVLDLADGTKDYTVNNRITLLFVKTKGKWKIVHEHHSQAQLEE
jgi:hypothetical protein